jgi:comEA protein
MIRFFSLALFAACLFAAPAFAQKGADPGAAAVKGPKTKAGKATAEKAPGPIDLNTATVEQLKTLKGIGQKKAEAIIAWREANGGFKSVDQLTEVKGIGEKTLEKLRPFLKIPGIEGESREPVEAAPAAQPTKGLKLRAE